MGSEMCIRDSPVAVAPAVVVGREDEGYGSSFYYCWPTLSRRIQIGATAVIVARYLPLSSGSLLSARMQQDIRADPLFLLVVSAPASSIDRRLLVPFAADAMKRYSRSQNLFALRSKESTKIMDSRPRFGDASLLLENP